MSANSDARSLLRLAEARGLRALRVNRDGGYVIYDAYGEVVARIPSNGRGVRHWVANARRAIEQATA